MICLLAGSRLEALRFAFGQQMKQDEWFCPESHDDFMARTNFHVIVLPGFANLPDSFRDRLFITAKERGSRK